MEDFTTEKGFKKNIIDKLQNEDTWISLGQGLLKIILIMAIANIIIRIGKIAIHNVFKLRNLSPLKNSERREETLAKLLDNTITYVVYFIAFMMVLSVFGINVEALIAGAGVVGLAVGFGAQSLVKDVISGFFIIFEDQFSVGDHIRVGEFEGNVEAIGLRTTKIKSWTGEVHILPNGSITQVTNFSINNSIAVIDIAIAYGEDIEKAQKVIEEALTKMPNEYEELVDTPQLLGIQSMGQAEVVLRIIAETLPMQHSTVARMIRKDIKVILDDNGIKVPAPKFVMYPDKQPK
ncbi:mechanosensitive ion channel family protein [Neobacillus sp. OS1-32]|jgi:small-conductance mechanosensitive channel|uniref:Mechanosensitive ion channel family protein n=1 Tax=Neobacillus paridis TaxID=2803862 RepID=A0ABS1TQP7_9BACI|nr:MULTISPECIES: mechanosensitive ion channel family protein [Neobacillus]MBL4953374.1 mechanosensitive ion channel family protein [Neobacillus paridis]WML29538.1 mechanosensitive ion channel family protein [Neobacillus sp. OS1-32]